jgi:uncharacterized protein (TIGR03085 family)
MDPTSLLRRERQALCETLSGLGPDAPTLCQGWTTADLAAHLVVREREPLAALGIVLPGPFVSFNHRRMEAAKARGYDWLVTRLRSGPPRPWRLRPVAAADIVENFVHHEDARRANGLDPRLADPDLDPALWRMVRPTGWRQLRRFRGFGVVAGGTNGRDAVLRRGFPEVRISGSPGDLLLYLLGRKQAARVELSGSDMAVAALENAPLRA